MSFSEFPRARLFAEDWAEGLNRLERNINTGLVLLTLTLWGLFLFSLRQDEGGRRRFCALLFFHLAPLSLAFFSTYRNFWQFWRFGLLGGLALVLGVPHHFWPPGKRAKPRILIAVAAALAFAAMAASARWIFPERYL